MTDNFCRKRETCIIRPDDSLRDACCGLDVFEFGGWVGREEVLYEIRWNALKKVRVLNDAGESIILFFIIITIIIIISIIFFYVRLLRTSFTFVCAMRKRSSTKVKTRLNLKPLCEAK